MSKDGPTHEAAPAVSTGDDTPAVEAPEVATEIVKLLAKGYSLAADGLPDMPAYDGQAVVALDADVLADMDATTDLLTTAHDLFEIPALHLPADLDDASGM